jgi:K+-sensing histidine kinase KdpD
MQQQHAMLASGQIDVAFGYHELMLLHNASQWSKSKPLWLGYFVCLGSTALATLIRLWIHDLVEPNLPFQVFYLSLIATTFWCGWYFGVLAAIFSTLLGFYFFIQPYDSFELPSITDRYLIAVNLSTMLLCVLAVEYLQRLLYSANVLLKASSNNYRLFIRSENHLLNLKLAIAEYEKLVKMMSSSDETLVLWVDHLNITHWFDQSNRFISSAAREKADGQFLNLFQASQHPLILNHINDSLDNHAAVEFNYQDTSDASPEPQRIGRLTPITIDGQKTLLFSVRSPSA